MKLTEEQINEAFERLPDPNNYRYSNIEVPVSGFQAKIYRGCDDMSIPISDFKRIRFKKIKTISGDYVWIHVK